jgi:hypothetical protein
MKFTGGKSLDKVKLISNVCGTTKSNYVTVSGLKSVMATSFVSLSRILGNVCSIGSHGIFIGFRMLYRLLSAS